MRCHVAVVVMMSIGLADGVRTVDVDKDQLATTDDEMDLTCALIVASFIASLPIVVPGLHAIPGIALGVCCPIWVIDKAKELKGKIGKSDYDKWLIEHGGLSAEDLNELAEDEQRAQIMDLYSDLMQMRVDNNSPSKLRKLVLQLKKLSPKEANFETNYEGSMEALDALAEQRPWVLYPRIAATLESRKDGLWPAQILDMTQALVALKQAFPFLPHLEDESLPAELRAEPELKDLQEEAQKDADESDENFGRKMLSFIKKGQKKTCGAIGRVAMKLTDKIMNAMKKPNDAEFEFLKVHVQKIVFKHFS